MKVDEMNKRDKTIYELKKRWQLTDSGLARIFKLSRERISQILEKEDVDNRFDTDKNKR